jgi:branched-chain amino acid transport system permease protein
MSQFVDYALPGIPWGCVFALLAAGLVLAYRTSGVFNFAFGAQAYVSALVFYVSVHAGWGTFPSFLLAVAFLGPLLGLLLDAAIYRHIRSAPVVVKLTGSLGMLIALPQIAQAVFGNKTRLAPPSLFLNPNRVYFRIGTYPLNGLEISTVVVTVAVVAIFGAMIRFTPIGLQMRAVVESPRLAELHGVRASRVGAIAWALSSFIAALAGVLLAPLFATLSSLDFTTLLVSAIAAAAFGAFVSLPLALVGGIVLGVAQEVIGGYLPATSIIAHGIRPGLPFLVLVALLLAVPSLRRIRTHATDPLSGCDPPPPSTASPHASPLTRRVVAIGWTAMLGVVVASCLTWLTSNWVDNFSQAMIFSIIFLSITLLTGIAGQISLAQMTFAGVGAFAAGHLASSATGLPVLVGVLVGGFIAALLGALVAIPGLRLGGISLALLTLAFALLADNVVFPEPWAGNGATGVDVPRPEIGSMSFATSHAFFLLCLTILAACALAVRMLSRGTVGQFLTAMRGSEIAAESIGVNTAAMKVLAFSLAGFVAGIGGGLYGSFQTTVSPNDFNYFFSLTFVVVVMIVGSRTVGGAIQAGFVYVLLEQFFTSRFLPNWMSPMEPVLFGLAALTFVTHPEGVVEHLRKVSVDAIERQLAKRLGRTSARRTKPSAPASPQPGGGTPVTPRASLQ